MTRILFISHTAQLGGAEQCLVDLARLHAPSCQVVVLDDGPLLARLAQHGINTIQLAGGGLHHVRKQSGVRAILGALGSIAQTVRQLRTYALGCDLIWANTHKAFVVSVLVGRWVGRPVFYHLHDMLDPGHFSWWNRRGVVTLANLLAQGVVANSEATARSFVVEGGRPALVRTLYNGFEFRTATPLRPAQGFVLGLFSRISPWKGQHVLLAALAQLEARFTVLLVGDALFPEDQRYLEQLKIQIQTLGLTDRVLWLGFREDVAALMAGCDVIVHCSVLPEAFGRVVVEGMAQGRPVIATNSGGVPEIIVDGQTGLLVPPGDATALAQAVTRLAQDPIWAEQLAQAGRTSVRQRFNLQATAQQMDRILLEIPT